MFVRLSSVGQVSCSQLFEKNLVESYPFRRLVSSRLETESIICRRKSSLNSHDLTLARPAPLSPTSSSAAPPHLGVPSAACRALSFPCRAPDPREGSCPAKTAGRPLFASLVAFARKWVCGTPWPMTCCESRPPRYSTVTRVLPSSCQASTESQDNGWREVPLQDSRALVLARQLYSIKPSTHAAFLRLR